MNSVSCRMPKHSSAQACDVPRQAPTSSSPSNYAIARLNSLGTARLLSCPYQLPAGTYCVLNCVVLFANAGQGIYGLQYPLLLLCARENAPLCVLSTKVGSKWDLGKRTARTRHSVKDSFGRGFAYAPGRLPRPVLLRRLVSDSQLLDSRSSPHGFRRVCAASQRVRSLSIRLARAPCVLEETQ